MCLNPTYAEFVCCGQCLLDPVTNEELADMLCYLQGNMSAVMGHDVTEFRIKTNAFVYTVLIGCLGIIFVLESGLNVVRESNELQMGTWS